MAQLNFVSASATLTGNGSGTLSFATSSEPSLFLWGLSSLNISLDSSLNLPREYSLRLATNYQSADSPPRLGDGTYPIDVTASWSQGMTNNASCTVGGLICTTQSTNLGIQVASQNNISNDQNNLQVFDPVTGGAFTAVAWLNGFDMSFDGSGWLTSIGGSVGIANGLDLTGTATGLNPQFVATSILLGNATSTSTLDASAIFLSQPVPGIEVQFVDNIFNPNGVLYAPVGNSNTLTFGTLSSVTNVVVFINSFFGQFDPASQQLTLGNPVLQVTTVVSGLSGNSATVTTTMNMAGQYPSGSAAQWLPVDSLACGLVVIAYGTPSS